MFVRINQLSNLSSGWVGFLTRNTPTDSTDIVTLFTKIKWGDAGTYDETLTLLKHPTRITGTMAQGALTKSERRWTLNLGTAYTLWENKTNNYNLASKSGLEDIQISI